MCESRRRPLHDQRVAKQRRRKRCFSMYCLVGYKQPRMIMLSSECVCRSVCSGVAVSNRPRLRSWRSAIGRRVQNVRSSATRRRHAEKGQARSQAVPEGRGFDSNFINPAMGVRGGAAWAPHCPVLDKPQTYFIHFELENRIRYSNVFGDFYSRFPTFGW